MTGGVAYGGPMKEVKNFKPVHTLRRPKPLPLQKGESLLDGQPWSWELIFIFGIFSIPTFDKMGILSKYGPLSKSL